MALATVHKKAMEASFPPDRWPAEEMVGPNDSVRFVLKDGTGVLRVPSPPPIYDYQAGSNSQMANS
jgi:hypothetical protein